SLHDALPIFQFVLFSRQRRGNLLADSRVIPQIGCASFFGKLDDVGADLFNIRYGRDRFIGMSKICDFCGKVNMSHGFSRIRERSAYDITYCSRRVRAVPSAATWIPAGTIKFTTGGCAVADSLTSTVVSPSTCTDSILRSLKYSAAPMVRMYSCTSCLADASVMVSVPSAGSATVKAVAALWAAESAKERSFLCCRVTD